MHALDSVQLLDCWLNPDDSFSQFSPSVLNCSFALFKSSHTLMEINTKMQNAEHSNITGQRSWNDISVHTQKKGCGVGFWGVGWWLEQERNARALSWCIEEVVVGKKTRGQIKLISWRAIVSTFQNVRTVIRERMWLHSNLFLKTFCCLSYFAPCS